MNANRMTPLSADAHFSRMRRWLDMEGEAEKERLAQRRAVQNSANAERGGETLLDLVVRSHTTGLGGRYLVRFSKRKSQHRLPWHRFKVGSPVIVSSDGKDSGSSYSGVVSKRKQDSIEVALPDWPEGDRFRIDLSPDEVTRKRQLAALKSAEQATGRHGQLRDILLYDREPQFSQLPNLTELDDLNPSQQEAVRFAMSSQDLAIIHGPPGTGKTTTVVEVIRCAVQQGARVLACAPSNTAVDNLVERLSLRDCSVVRLGHPARVLEVVRKHTLDALVERHDMMDVVQDLLQEVEQLQRQASRYTRSRPARGHRQRQREEIRELRQQARMLERQAVADVLMEASVVCATVSFDFDILSDHHFDLLVIDEACQSVEPGCWVPLHLADRVVLAGDHCQLPPTIISKPAAAEGFDVSLMQRLVEHLGNHVTRLLTVQYRMHEQIAQFSSNEFYGGSLHAHQSVQSHSLADLTEWHSDSFDTSPVTFIDTAGTGWQEEQEEDGLSRLNTGEGQLVLQQVRALCDSGLKPRDIAVIAPYAAQVRWLRQQSTYDHLEIDTVDGFQGREKEAVVISLVRSNTTGEIGFLADQRRMNVAMTRARRKLIIIGDSATLASDDFFSRLLDWLESINGYHSAFEFQSFE